MRLLLLFCFITFTRTAGAATIIVRNIEELDAANKTAVPGDVIVLQNGEWKNITIRLNCAGTKEKPITFKAQTAGKVMITGHSKLKLGGSFIVVDGLYFTNGYAGTDDVITFRIDSKQIANNCRVTNTAINDFNNSKRMDENNWVAFYGKNNRLDHCSFVDKKNMGVLLAVILDDDRSRENFHSIDNNYFGRKPPLASNGGEIIRVGVSQHCQYNSNTRIKNNFFEDCDGETEIISIKSGANVVEENTFEECQGSVVLRHGDNNIVRANYFLGNDKPATGGVRVINKGQKILDNIFYKCRGVDFRSPLAIMNGIPNSPAHRYVQVSDAEITGNSFYECAPISLCEGSDTERTLPPVNVIIARNSFYNTRDSIIYKVYDEIGGIRFSENRVNDKVPQELPGGSIKTKMLKEMPFRIQKNKILYSGASWFHKPMGVAKKPVPIVNCATPQEVYASLQKKEPLTIRLTGKEYLLDKPFIIYKPVIFTSDKRSIIRFNTGKLLSVFIISGKGNLELNNLLIDGKNVEASHFISSDSSGWSDHYNFTMTNCTLQNFSSENGCRDIFYAFKYMIADSIIIRKNSFANNTCNFLMMNEEIENKGYYNAEKIWIGHNYFNSQNGTLLNVYRGGNDESTLGPNLSFSHNKINNCNNKATDPLIMLTGVQVSNIFSNNFSGCATSATLIAYKDMVRARHSVQKNILSNSGKIETNQFVAEKNNIRK